MGGNSSSSVGSSTPISTPTKVDPSQKKIDKLLTELSKLSPAERLGAVEALEEVGLDGLAKALKAISAKGSRPTERP